MRKTRRRKSLKTNRRKGRKSRVRRGGNKWDIPFETFFKNDEEAIRVEGDEEEDEEEEEQQAIIEQARIEQERIEQEQLQTLNNLLQQAKTPEETDVVPDTTRGVKRNNNNLFHDYYPFTKEIDELLKYFDLIKQRNHGVENRGAVKQRLSHELFQLKQFFEDYYHMNTTQEESEKDNEFENKSKEWRNKIFFLKQGEYTYWDTDQNRYLDDIFMEIQTNLQLIESNKRRKK